MNVRSRLSTLASSQTTETFQLAKTPVLIHSDLLMTSSIDANSSHGCLVLDQEFEPQNNPENIISEQTHFWIQTITYTGIVPLFFLVGVPGNILSAAVFYRQGLKERINFCLFCLAIADLVVIIGLFCMTAENRYRFFIGPSNFFIKYFVGLGGFTWVSMFLSTVVAAERCFCVVSPLRAQRMLSTRTLVVIVVAVSTVLLTGKMLIVGPKHTEACVFDPKTNSTTFIIYFTEYYLNNKEILDIFDTFVYATALPITCFVVIIFTTVITTVKLQSVVRWRQQSSSAFRTQATGSSEYQMVSVTRMLIATSVLFVVCLCPTLFIQMAMFSVPELKLGGRYHNLLDIFWTSIFVLRLVNSTLNFFIYYQMGTRFRQTLNQLLPCKGTRFNRSLSNLVQTSKTLPSI